MHDAFVVEAELDLDEDFDPAAVGAAVTTELCGHWEHQGPCRWPHNSAIDSDRDRARFRTLFVADAAEADEVRSACRPCSAKGRGGALCRCATARWRMPRGRSRSASSAGRARAMTEQFDAIVVGGGLAGLVATAELALAGRRVALVEQEPDASLGGQAFWSSGGLFLVDSPEQQRLRIKNSHKALACASTRQSQKRAYERRRAAKPAAAIVTPSRQASGLR